MRGLLFFIICVGVFVYFTFYAPKDKWETQAVKPLTEKFLKDCKTQGPTTMDTAWNAHCDCAFNNMKKQYPDPKALQEMGFTMDKDLYRYSKDRMSDLFTPCLKK